MNIRIDIECTPEEARAFFGLPDVRPIQEAALADMAERIKAAMAAMDPETLIKTWMPLGIQGFEQLQKAFWSNVPGAKGGDAAKK